MAGAAGNDEQVPDEMREAQLRVEQEHRRAKRVGKAAGHAQRRGAPDDAEQRPASAKAIEVEAKELHRENMRPGMRGKSSMVYRRVDSKSTAFALVVGSSWPRPWMAIFQSIASKVKVMSATCANAGGSSGLGGAGTSMIGLVSVSAT